MAGLIVFHVVVFAVLGFFYNYFENREILACKYCGCVYCYKDSTSEVGLFLLTAFLGQPSYNQVYRCNNCNRTWDTKSITPGVTTMKFFFGFLGFLYLIVAIFSIIDAC